MSTSVVAEIGSQPASIPARSWFVLVCVVGVALIFVVPYHVPVKPSFSASYLFGYNSMVGTLLVLLVSAVAALWSRGNLLPQARSLDMAPGIPSRWLWIGMLLVVFGCIVMNVLFGGLEGMNESSYDVVRTWLLSHGLRPYLDFEWPFGAGLLYVSLWAARLFHVGVA